MLCHYQLSPCQPLKHASLAAQRTGTSTRHGTPSAPQPLWPRSSTCCSCMAGPASACSTAPAHGTHGWSKPPGSRRLPAQGHADVTAAAASSSSTVQESAADMAIQLDACACSTTPDAASASPSPSPRTFSPAAAVACPACSGKGTLVCKACEGRGRLSRAGYNKKNTLNMQRILNSKWTAMEETLGWRHFRVMQQRKAGGSGLVFLLMQASCDPSAQLWVNSQILRDRGHWAAGWLQKSEMNGTEDPSAETGGPCQRCSALGVVPCRKCQSSGAAVIDIR